MEKTKEAQADELAANKDLLQIQYEKNDFEKQLRTVESQIEDFKRTMADTE